VKLHHDPFGRLVLTRDDGDVVVGVVPVRCFPFTAPTGHVAFLDHTGHEVFHLHALGDADPATRAVLEEDLRRREFIPVVHRIISISPGAEPTEWCVDTDRGETRFLLPSEDNVRRLGTHGVLVSDAHGVRFRILDSRRMDPASRRFLGRYL
jgi:hypothetical protein